MTGLLESGARMPSEKELADEYEVSTQTVNKAFSILVSAGYLERKLGAGTYVVDHTRLADLKSAFAFTVGIVLDSNVRSISEADSVLGRIAFNLQYLLNQCENNWVLVTLDDQDAIERARANVHGIITVGDVSQSFISRVVETRMPAVTFNRDFTHLGIPSVCVSAGGIGELVSRSYGLGHRNFLFVYEKPDKQIYDIRFRDYEKAVSRLDDKCAVERLGLEPESLDARRLTDEVRHAIRAADLAFLPHDSMAISFLRLLSENGITVPEAMSVCGYDNTVVSRHYPVPVTTIAYDLMETCRTLVEAIDNQLRGRAVPIMQQIDSWLVARESLARRKAK